MAWQRSGADVEKMLRRFLVWRPGWKNLHVTNVVTGKSTVEGIDVTKSAVWIPSIGVSLFVENNCAVDTTSVWSLVTLVTAHHVLCQDSTSLHATAEQQFSILPYPVEHSLLSVTSLAPGLMLVRIQ